MKKVELLAPAGNLEKLKIAFLYGADACYVGGKKFSLRARASNFSLDDIKKGAEFASDLGRKLYVTMNIVPHDEDLDGLEEYLKFLERVGVSGIIVSSFYIAKVAKMVSPKLELHLSTQASVSNSSAIQYYQEKGFSRVVLARELSSTQIKEIARKTDLEIEVFIHGGMCVAYSGRCMLSNYMTLRDANRGGCAHSCRWNYCLYRSGQDENLCTNGFMNMGSKDLNAIRQVEQLIKSGVKSLKIEGRMKSLYYIACITKTYRTLIDQIYHHENIDYDFFASEILKAENRLTATGFLEGEIKLESQLYNVRAENPTKDFLGIVLDYNETTKVVILEQRNFFRAGDAVEFFGPTLDNIQFVVPEIKNIHGEVLECARHPLEIICLNVPFKVSKNDMMRKR